MSRALVIGGTGFFGIDLVNTLLDGGWDVTVATKNASPAPFRGEPKRAQVDRYQPASLEALARTGTWDVLYDQRCFSSYDARILLDAMEGRIGKLVHTSSIAVYRPGSMMEEALFDAREHPYEIGPRRSYDDGKRDAEAVYAQTATVPVAIARLAVVLGFPDTSHRLPQHVQAIANGAPIHLPNPEAKTSLISRTDAGRLVASLGMLDVTGPVNGAAPTPVSLRELYECMASELGKELRLSQDPKGSFPQKYGREYDTSISAARAIAAGISTSEVHDFLPAMVQEVKHVLIDRDRSVRERSKEIPR